MTTTTKIKPVAVDLTPADIENNSPRFLAPDESLLPPHLHDAVKLVRATRRRWIEAVAVKRHADRAARSADADHKNQLLQAALNGDDQSTVRDDRPVKMAAAKAAAENAKVAERAVEARWIELIDGIAAHRDEVLALNEPALSSAEQELTDLEARTRAHREHTERLRAQTAWFTSIGRSNHNRASTENGSPFRS